MKKILESPSLNLLRNQIDFTRVPFSDRGSRLLVFPEPEKSQLYIRLAERLTSIEADIEAYLRRPPFIRGLCIIDGEGKALEYELTSYPHALYFTTRLGDFSLAFQDNHTLVFGLPPDSSPAGIQFHVSPQLWKETPQGGEFKSIRDLSYTTNSEPILNRITPEGGGYKIDFIVRPNEETSIAFFIGKSLPAAQDLLPFSTICDQAELRWQEWFGKAPPVAEHFRRTYTYAWWVMANNLVRPLGSIAYEAMMPSKVNYVGLWLWDSAMHALAFRHVDPELARNQIRVMLTCQLPDGMLPDAVYDEGIISEIDHPIRAEVTKPPILAWMVLKLHETDPNLEFLQEVYVPLVRWNAWWFSMNDDDVDGLAQYNHPYSSGLDNSPLWDEGMPVESPDLNTYLCVQMGSLALIAEALGMQAEALMWRRRSAAIVRRMIDDFWDPQAGVFRATHEDQPIQVITPFNLYPLWTGQLPHDIRTRLIEHLTNPDEFWGDLALPTVARNDPRYDPDTMWRGPIWANINYFFIEALRQLGEHGLAQELTQKTLDLIINHPGVYEYYNAETGTPPTLAAEAFGWTAAVFIDLAITASREATEAGLPPD
ncbi:MAG: trehalase family glycosidase [Chloroflexota bacterium]